MHIIKKYGAHDTLKDTDDVSEVMIMFIMRNWLLMTKM